MKTYITVESLDAARRPRIEEELMARGHRVAFRGEIPQGLHFYPSLGDLVATRWLSDEHRACAVEPLNAAFRAVEFYAAVAAEDPRQPPMFPTTEETAAHALAVLRRQTMEFVPFAGHPPPFDASDMLATAGRRLLQAIDHARGRGVRVSTDEEWAVAAAVQAADRRSDTPEKRAWRRANGSAIQAVRGTSAS